VAISEISSEAAVTEDPADQEPVPVLSIVIPATMNYRRLGAF
jgi:hypothetical protein